MKNRIVAILLLACMALSLLAGCSSNKHSALTVEEAQKIVLKDLGVKEDEVSDLHTHITTSDGIACYSIHVTVDGTTMEYLINGITGEILSAEEGGH